METSSKMETIPASDSPSTPRRLEILRRRGRDAATGLAFITPALAIVAVFLAYPIYRTVRLGLYDWDGLSPTARWIGLGNYHDLLHVDPFFWRAVRNTAVWAALTIPAELLVGLALALLLDRKLRFRVGFRTIFFLPAVLSPVVIGSAWNSMFTPDRGAFSQLMGLLGFNPHNGWLGDPRLALYGAVIANTWRYSGLMMIFYLAALQTIPPSLYEAARVDGAPEWQQIRRITLPLLKPMTVLLVLLGSIGALREFDLMYILTGGGPAHASDLFSIQIFQEGFQFGRVGYASAIATILLGVTLVAATLQLAYLARVHRTATR
jgi:ABC-type sugar transport system permease subunit